MHTLCHPLHSRSLFPLFWLPLLPCCPPPPPSTHPPDPRRRGRTACTCLREGLQRNVRISACGRNIPQHFSGAGGRRVAAAKQCGSGGGSPPDTHGIRGCPAVRRCTRGLRQNGQKAYGTTAIRRTRTEGPFEAKSNDVPPSPPLKARPALKGVLFSCPPPPPSREGNIRGGKTGAQKACLPKKAQPDFPNGHFCGGGGPPPMLHDHVNTPPPPPPG